MENKRIYALADHAVDEVDLALGNEFDLAARNRVEKILLDLVAETAREATAEAYEEGIQKAQELRDTQHLRSLWDDHHASGAEIVLDEMQEHLHALKDSLVAEPVS
jgi:hypothetical protein